MRLKLLLGLVDGLASRLAFFRRQLAQLLQPCRELAALAKVLHPHIVQCAQIGRIGHRSGCSGCQVFQIISHSRFFLSGTHRHSRPYKLTHTS
jgi:hypothetical protein